MNWDEILFNRFLFAIPELKLDDNFIEFGVRNGFINSADAETIRKWRNTFKRTRSKSAKILSHKSFIGKVLAIMPEIMSVQAVDFIKRMGYLDTTQANALRVIFSGARLLQPLVVPEATLLERITGVYGALTSNYLVNFVRDLDDARIAQIRATVMRARGLDPNTDRISPEDNIAIKAAILRSIKRAQVGRSVLSGADIIALTAKAAAQQKTVWGALTLILENLVGSSEEADRMLKNAIRAGVIDESSYDLIRSLEKLGMNAWRKTGKSFQYDGWQARALLITEGILSPEMINALRAGGVISPELARLLYPAATSIRAITRTQLSKYIGSTKFHPVGGESPIQTYARITGRTDRQILSVLQEAAADAKKAAKIAAAKGTISGLSRSAQQRAVQASINNKMRELWEHVGHLTIFGEKDAARAGVEGINFLNNRLFAPVGKADAGQARSLAATARAGTDAFIGREENIMQLSKRVYNNIALSQGFVQREIQKALLRGVSAEELAARVSRMIQPGTPGGISYAAMRLARTEINNAFHFSTIQYSRDMPWVEGYEWHRSNRHGHADACDVMANSDHDGIGRGVYKKNNVPGKPHPQCLCYITAVTVDNGKFERRLLNGAYDKYLKQSKGGVFNSEYSRATTTRDAGYDWLKEAAVVAAETAAATVGIKLAREFSVGFFETYKG